MEKAFLADAFPRQRRSVRSSDECLRPSGQSGRCLPFRGTQSFPPRGWRVYSCARRRTLVPVEVSGCACAPHNWKQPTRLGYTRRCSISEASPLDYHIHSEVPFGVERSSVFYLVADRHPFECAGERVYQGLVLVDLRARSMTQKRMPRVRVRRTATGAPRRQELLSPQKTPSRGHEFQRWNDLGRVDRSRPQEGSGLLCRALAKPLVSFPPCGSPVTRGGDVSGSCSGEATYLS